jgi:hypothetical protein
MARREEVRTSDLEQFTKTDSRVLGRRKPSCGFSSLGSIYQYSRCAQKSRLPAFGAPKPLATSFCKML